jgi:8-oxo-dGTP pyrophosphatase MutT (NUDIX family)
MVISLYEILQDTNNTAGILIKCNNEYMLCQRSSGKWSIPKGHIHKNEQPLEGALRELEEETAIQLEDQPKQISTTKNKEGGNYHIFGIDVPEKLTPVLDHEHTDYGYFTQDNLPQPLDKGLNFLKNSH